MRFATLRALRMDHDEYEDSAARDANGGPSIGTVEANTIRIPPDRAIPGAADPSRPSAAEARGRPLCPHRGNKIPITAFRARLQLGAPYVRLLRDRWS